MIFFLNNFDCSFYCHTVALLVPRGRCTIQTKAMVASALLPRGVVHHLIVYGYVFDPDDENDDDKPSYDQYPEGDGSFYDISSSIPAYPTRRDDYVRRDEEEAKDDDKINVTILYISGADGNGKILMNIPKDDIV